VSDIDTAVVDSLKLLDPKRPIREADIERSFQFAGGNLYDAFLGAWHEAAEFSRRSRWCGSVANSGAR